MIPGLMAAAAAANPNAAPTFFQPASQSSTQVINSMHLDYIHKVAFDTYGRRLATCSGDRSVRVWDLDDSGQWELTAAWQAHGGSVTSLCWAHPEFGSILATCSSDLDAKIWEERSSHSAMASSTWVLKARLTEARRAVTCLEFAPRHWGLKLAVGSADGCIRIYEAVDIMNLAQWPLAATLQQSYDDEEQEDSINATYSGALLGCTSLSWCSGRFEPPTLVAGGSDLVVYRYSDTARAWKPILRLLESSPQQQLLNVLDVAWAPNVGRRFHYIASAEGEQLRIYKLSREAPPSAKSSQELSVESVQLIPTSAWRCQWNVTGTVLASSGDSGIVNMWKAGGSNTMDGTATMQFSCVASVHGDLSQVVS